MSNRVTGFSSAGGFTNLIYDRCAYQKDVYQSVEPLSFMMYPGKFENCGKCVYDKNNFWRPFDAQIVDAESELKNITRRASKCPQYQYKNDCKKSCYCTSTFDKTNPIVYPAEMCAITHNNLPRMVGPGYTLNTDLNCQARVQRQPERQQKVVRK